MQLFLTSVSSGVDSISYLKDNMIIENINVIEELI